MRTNTRHRYLRDPDQGADSSHTHELVLRPQRGILVTSAPGSSCPDRASFPRAQVPGEASVSSTGRQGSGPSRGRCPGRAERPRRHLSPGRENLELCFPNSWCQRLSDKLRTFFSFKDLKSSSASARGRRRLQCLRRVPWPRAAWRHSPNSVPRLGGDATPHAQGHGCPPLGGSPGLLLRSSRNLGAPTLPPPRPLPSALGWPVLMPTRTAQEDKGTVSPTGPAGIEQFLLSEPAWGSTTHRPEGECPGTQLSPGPWAG